MWNVKCVLNDVPFLNPFYLLLVEKQDVAPNVALGTTVRKQSKQECTWENHPSFKTHVEGHTKSNHNMDLGPTKI